MNTPIRFAYTRSVAPMLWVVFGIAGVELIVTHFLLSLWWPLAAMVLSILTLGGMIWFASVIAGFNRHPVEVRGDGILMRVGRLQTIFVPARAIAGIRGELATGEARDRSVLNLALIAYPNVVVDLQPPLARRSRTIRAVAHRLDDPAAFVAAAGALVASR